MTHPPASSPGSSRVALILGGVLAATPVVLSSTAPGAPSTAPPARDDVDFFRDVRPVLSDHCFHCHGPDEETLEGDLRLDLRDHVFADRGGYATVVAGDPDASELIYRIEDAGDPMPPEGDGEPLTDAEKELLRRWVEQGAPWPEQHWSFAPVARPEPPAVRDEAWVRGEIDRFVLARLEAEGLRASDEAPREAWLRRVTFDLTGLPPTPDELDDFLADESADAYERVVDRLFASEHYGERQAQDWLDLARYADSNGNQFDEPRTNWKWRDWVIDAFNANMPFDQFTVEQLAGDLLPSPTQAQWIATGFNRNNPTDTDAPSEPDEYRTEYVIDRVHTTATTWMGLTMSCAQCHDHKYDPITQEDFYSFYSFFNDVAERDIDYGNPRPRMRVPSPDQAPLLADLDERIAALEARLEAPDPYLDAEQARWTGEQRERLGDTVAWTHLEPVGMLSRNGSRLREQDDGSILAAGPRPARDTYDLVLRTDARVIEALRLEVLPDPAREDGASGRSDEGLFHLSRLEIRNATIADAGDPPLVYMALAQADLEQSVEEDVDVAETVARPGAFAGAVAYPVEPGAGGGDDSGFFGRRSRGWTLVGGARTEPHEAILIPLEPLELNESSILRITMEQDGGVRAGASIARFRWTATDDPRLRQELVPVAPKLWSTLGPWPATDAAAAFATEYAPESELEDGVDRLRRHEVPELDEESDEGATDRSGRDRDAGEGRAARGREGAGEERVEERPRESERDDRDRDAPELPDFLGFGREDEGPAELAWRERRGWRDGSEHDVDVETGAVYFVRSVTCVRPATATLRLDGPAGVKLWINGELTYEDAPEPPASEAPESSDDDGEFDFFDFFGGRRDDAEPERIVRVGLRAGANEIVVKGVFEAPPEDGGEDGRGAGAMLFSRRGSDGPAVTFDFHVEDQHVLTYELARALRDSELVEPASEIATPILDRRDDPIERIAPAPADRSAADARAELLRDHFRRHVSPVGRALHDELARLEEERDELVEDIPEAMVMADRAESRQAYVFERGDWRERGAEVDTATPSVLPPMDPELPRNRLGLARWLVDGENPLTARVTVNRAWQQFFGTGIVESSEDFGIRATTPSHPLLLDWLAAEFVESGWDWQALQRRIVLSATYRQSARATAELLERDPENRLLARGPRVRLSAEMIRDNALAVSGLLHDEVGGPSAMPYQAPGLWAEVFGFGGWSKADGPEQYRRGLYVYWKRRVPFPSMVAFDANKGETCVTRRPETNTPTQALVLLNNPVYVEAAKMLGQRLLGHADGDHARIAHGFRLCTSRAPDEAEAAVLLALLEEQRAFFADDEEAAAELLSIGDAEVDAGHDACELAAWAQLASVLLNLDATIHKG